MIGVVGNIVLIWYFMTHVRYDLPTILYLMCCINDILTSVLVLFVAVCFLNERDDRFFGDDTFCKSWALLSRINQRIMVFLVMVLSISRTISLTSPLRQIRRRFALVSIGIWVFLAILYEVVLTSKLQQNFAMMNHFKTFLVYYSPILVEIFRAKFNSEF